MTFSRHQSTTQALTLRVTSLRIKPLAMAISLACAGVAALPLSGLVAQAQAAETSVRQYNIPAGDLTSVLATFAQASGILVAGNSELAADKTSQGLQGSFGVNAALEQILAGTGLYALPQNDGSYALSGSKVNSDGTVQLAPVQVTGAGLAATTEGSGSYTTGAMSSSTKLSMTARQTPQSVSVITSQQMADQNLVTLEEALTNSPGISVKKNGNNRLQYYARGFSISNISYDGLTTSNGSYAQDNFTAPDMAIYDRVEVVRGATGLLTGTGNPSASVNLIRKRPTEEFQGHISGHLGTWNNERLEADVSGALNDSGTVRGRVVAAAQDEDSFMDDIYNNSRVFYGIVEADVTDSTMVTFSANLQNNDRGSTWYMQPYGLNRDSNINPEWARHNTDNESYRLELDQALANDWVLKLAGTYMKADAHFVDVNHTGTFDPATGAGLFIANPTYFYNEETQESFDISATGPFSLAGREHELVVGASYRTRDFTPWTTPWNRFPGHTQSIPNAYTWDNSSAMAEPDNWGSFDKGTWDYSDEETSAYMTARWSLTDDLTLITGGRMTTWEYEQKSSDTTYEVDHEFTPYLGAVYDLNDNHSVYASYTSIFDPQNAYDASGSLLDPVEGKSYEVGVKGEYFGGRLNASAALYRIDQVNLSQTDYDGPSPCPYTSGTYCSEASGEVRSEGVELELSGAVTDSTELSVGYTYNDAYHSKDEDEQGERFDTKLPKHLLRASISHMLNEEWTVGGSVQAQSSIYNETSSGRTEQDTYAVANLMARWDITDQYLVRFNVNNIFDKEYYESIGTLTSGNLYGAPRSLLVTAQYSF